METLKLYWLGAPRVERAGQIIKLETRKAAALLCYLSLTPGNCQREILATMFWPEGSQQKALANLRRTLSSLNSSLPGWIEANRDTLALKRNGMLWVDVEAFHQYLLGIQNHSHSKEEACDGCIPMLENMIELIRGEFLEGLNLTDTPDFDEWQFFQRDELRQEFADVLQRLSFAHALRDRWEQAITCSRRWVALDRLHEPAQRALIDLYIRSGQRVAALRQYEEFTRLLKNELGQEPEIETQRLYDQIRGQEEMKHITAVSETPTSFPLLKTKLYIPTLPSFRVIRTRLIECLGQIEKKALTIISAPAGFGKSTLLTEWVTQTSLPVAWLSLDNGDNDPYRFLSYLIAALESIQEDVGDEAKQLMHSQQILQPHIILASLINHLTKVTEPYALVLDDYQFISEHAVHETMSYFLDHIPTNMHIVIATRADPPLHLGRLRVHEQMLELRTSDLRFTQEEAIEFMNEIMSLDLSLKDIQALETRTEGWVVGLKMAALALRGHENAYEFIRAFSGSHRYVLDYLMEEVLKRQPAYIQTFLLHTSILEKLSGLLCDALMNNEWRQLGGSGQVVLEYLENSNLFVVPLDEHKQWYRYHHLFADLLRAQMLKLMEKQDIARLHLHASEWYEQNSLVLDAIYHASLASDFVKVEQLIEQNYVEIVNRGEMSWLRFWTGKLSKEMVYCRPWLCIYEAQSHAWFGELEESNQLLVEAEKHIEILSPEGQVMMGHLSYVKSRVTAMRGDIHRAIELCLAARRLIPVSNLALQLDIGMTLAYEYFLDGNYIDAEPSLREIIRSSATVGSIINSVAAYCVLSRLYAVQGQLKKSYDHYLAAAQLIPEASGQHLGARALVENGIADVCCEWNNLDAALTRVKQGLSLLPWWGKADDFVLAYITLARIYLAQANTNDAIEAVEKAIEFTRKNGVFSEARNAIELVQVKLWLAQGDLQSASRWAESLQNRFSSNISIEFENEVALIAWARVQIAQNKFYEANDLLSSLEEVARSGVRKGRLIEIMLLKALALQAMGDTTQANVAIMESLTLAEPEGYMRIFLDEGGPMLKLLSNLSQSNLLNESSSYREFVNRLVGTFTLKEKIIA